MGGTVAVHAARGVRVGLCDVTRGELGSNGTPAERAAEAEAARAVLGAAWRENLAWPDGGITGDERQMVAAVRLIRQCRPKTVALPYWDDRHPDHRSSSEVLTRAAFKSGLRRFDEGASTAWRVDWILYYFINDSVAPSFGIDVSSHYTVKQQALACHQTQFTSSEPGSVSTRLTSPRFQQLIESRDAHLGAQLGVAYAEGVVVREPLLRPHIFKEWVADTPAVSDRL